LTDAGADPEALSLHEGEIAARKFDLEDAGTFTVDPDHRHDAAGAART
jgi:protease I